MIEIVLLDEKIYKKRCGLRLDRCFPFCYFSSKFHCAYFDNKAWLIMHFWAWQIIPYFLYHAHIHHTKHQVKYLMSILFSKVKKYGRPMGSSNQCHREHPGRIRARHLKDKGTIGQTNKFVRRPYQDWGSASSRPITLAKSTGPSTIHPDYKLSATRNWSPQLAATKAYSSACFHGNISTYWSVKWLKGQT